jgi:hypothetical protein
LNSLLVRFNVVIIIRNINGGAEKAEDCNIIHEYEGYEEVTGPQ